MQDMDRYEARKAMVEDLEEQGSSCKGCSALSQRWNT